MSHESIYLDYWVGFPLNIIAKANVSLLVSIRGSRGLCGWPGASGEIFGKPETWIGHPLQHAGCREWTSWGLGLQGPWAGKGPRRRWLGLPAYLMQGSDRAFARPARGGGCKPVRGPPAGRLGKALEGGAVLGWLAPLCVEAEAVAEASAVSVRTFSPFLLFPKPSYSLCSACPCLPSSPRALSRCATPPPPSTPPPQKRHKCTNN